MSQQTPQTDPTNPTPQTNNKTTQPTQGINTALLARLLLNLAARVDALEKGKDATASQGRDAAALIDRVRMALAKFDAFESGGTA
jgi:hypothetical protein